MLVPDTVKVLFVIALLAGAMFGTVWGLASFPPEQADIIRALPSEKLRQN